MTKAQNLQCFCSLKIITGANIEHGCIEKLSAEMKIFHPVLLCTTAKMESRHGGNRFELIINKEHFEPTVIQCGMDGQVWEWEWRLGMEIQRHTSSKTIQK
jgi:hypothetical protein